LAAEFFSPTKERKLDQNSLQMAINFNGISVENTQKTVSIDSLDQMLIKHSVYSQLVKGFWPPPKKHTHITPDADEKG